LKHNDKAWRKALLREVDATYHEAELDEWVWQQEHDKEQQAKHA
jgi:hypothetical protein